MIIGRSTAWSALNNNKHVVRNQPVIGVEGKPRRASSPAAALAARSEHVVERGRALGRAVCEAFRPMCACELSVGMLETEVDNADHGGTRIRELAAAGEGCECVIIIGCPSSAALPLRTRNNVEIASGDAPACMQDMTSDGL